MTMHLIDDGTLDTVFECSDCGQQERYSQEWRERFTFEDGSFDDALAGAGTTTAGSRC